MSVECLNDCWICTRDKTKCTVDKRCDEVFDGVSCTMEKVCIPKRKKCPVLTGQTELFTEVENGKVN